ncbi:MAG: hypothetical protein HYS12_25880 [Planctomycetes bacterium]|nr:hypothetical protein [Planctomycetota bacterium]
MLSVSAALLLAAISAAPTEKSRAGPAPELAPPIKLTAGSKPIDVDVGHAAPCVADLKGDGKPCLLVGQFGEGKLRVYPNLGTPAEPRFDQFEWFRAGGKLGTVPAS